MDKRLKILLLEDITSDVKIIWRALEKGGFDFERLVVDTKIKYIKALKDFSPDIILSDHSLPSFDSLRALAILQETGRKIPFILITATTSEEFAVDVIKKGADDYLLKDRLERLPSAVHNSLEKFRLEKEKQILLASASDELQKALNDLNKIMDSSLDVICSMNGEGKFVSVSAASASVWGYTPAELIGTSFMDLVFKEDVEATTKAAEKIISGIQVPIFENRYLHKNGRVVPILWSVNWDDEKQLMFCVAKDVTEIKKTEELLEKANNMARIGSYEIDLVKNTLYWSAITKQIHEVDNDFIPDVEAGLNFYKAGTSRESISRVVKEAIESNIPFDVELQIITAKNNERWVKVIGEAECIDGKCIRMYGSFQDIDNGKRAEIELLKVYEERNTILESIGDAFFAVDNNWMVTYWNNQAEKMLNISKEKIVGQQLWEVFFDSINSEAYRYYHKAIETKKSICFETYYKVKNKWFEVNAYPSHNGLSVFFKDITPQRNSENEQEKMTADIIQRNKALEQFSYIVSHNLRAPVANIIGLSFTLQKEGMDESLKKKVMSSLSFSVNKLDEVIKDLNSILKVRQDLSEHTQMVNFTNLTNDIRLSIESLIAAEKAVIICDFSNVDEMLTIKSYLHSIFYNLISNSLKYRQSNVPPIIEIKSQIADNKIVLLFKDNGLGIDLENKGDEVFGLYKRFHINKAKGKGMGLHMVKTQVEAIGGKISISSEVNKGTEFKIEFET